MSMNLRQMDSSETTWPTLLTLIEQGNITDQDPEAAADDFAYIDEKASSLDSCAVGEAINNIHPGFRFGVGSLNYIPAKYDRLIKLGDRFERQVKARRISAAWTSLGLISVYVQKNKDALIAEINGQFRI